jgi:hypothetical protein
MYMLDVRRQVAKMTHKQFANHLGVSKIGYYEARRGKKPGRKLLDAVLKKYPELQFHVLRNMLYWVRKEGE